MRDSEFSTGWGVKAGFDLDVLHLTSAEFCVSNLVSVVGHPRSNTVSSPWAGINFCHEYILLLSVVGQKLAL